MDDEQATGIKDIVLIDVDRELVRIAGRLLMAQEPGESRHNAMQGLVQDYLGDLEEAHPGVGRATLEEMAVNFSAVLLFEMERWTELSTEYTESQIKRRGPSSPRPRVLATIVRLLKAFDPRH